MSRIAIVGAGLSGRLLALNLGLQASSATTVLTVDRGDERYMGPAYSDEASYLLLNVPAGRMSALPDDPENFIKWARQRGIHAGLWDFLPRRVYRDYVLDLMREVQQGTDGPSFRHVRGDATDIEVATDDASATVRLGHGQLFTVDKVVLALGNFPPRHPPVRTTSALASNRYVRNPWNTAVLSGLNPTDTVFMIGTGQTTVDLAIALSERGHRGRIVAVSRRGVLPLAHRGFETYPSFVDELDRSSVLKMFRTIREHIARAMASGFDRRSVIDSLRPHTQALWSGLPTAEKRRFVRHAFRYWEIIRSRLPPQSVATIDAMRASGQLDVVAGRVFDLVEKDRCIEVHYTPRGQAKDNVERAHLVVNCIGPETVYRRIDDGLVKTLLQKGLIRPGPADIGIDAFPQGAVISRTGTPSRVLYTLGSPMKGVLWEVLAVPEIRLQARQLASTLLRRSAMQASMR